MRRVRHLNQTDYIIPLSQSGQVLALSNQSNILLKRTWHLKKPVDLYFHASFESSTINGISLIAYMEKDGLAVSSSIPSVGVYSVDPTNFSETFLFTKSMTQTEVYSKAYIAQSELGLNELSGAEIYSFLVTSIRKRKILTRKFYFNHLGCFDSIFRIKKAVQRLDIIKADV